MHPFWGSLLDSIRGLYCTNGPLSFYSARLSPLPSLFVRLLYNTEQPCPKQGFSKTFTYTVRYNSSRTTCVSSTAADPIYLILRVVIAFTAYWGIFLFGYDSTSSDITLLAQVMSHLRRPRACL
jgi:hypothetical protein